MGFPYDFMKFYGIDMGQEWECTLTCRERLEGKDLGRGAAFPDGNANSIRLRRVILLRSDIRLMPSGIRYASLWANRISLQGNALKYHFCEAKIAKQKLRSKNITLSKIAYHSIPWGSSFFMGGLFLVR